MRDHTLKFKSIDVVKCKKCLYEWVPKHIKPRQCPHCRSIKWNSHVGDNITNIQKVGLKVIKIINKNNSSHLSNEIISFLSNHFKNINVVDGNVLNKSVIENNSPKDTVVINSNKVSDFDIDNIKCRVLSDDDPDDIEMREIIAQSKKGIII